MEEKLKIIELIKSADISDIEWAYNIKESITNKFAKGYLSAKLSELNQGLSPNQEYFREDFLSFCEHDIWNDN